MEILDTSLRDGGHRTNFHFSDDQLKKILEPLDASGIEYIEIGYRNGSIRPIENLGRAGLCDKDYLLFCHSLIKKASLAVMAHPQNLNQSDIEELKACSVGLLRICVAKNDLAIALPIIDLANKMNLMVSVNFIHLSYYTEQELNQVVKEVSHHKPSMIYFADSNGNLGPDTIQKIYKQFTTKYTIPFGFHAHDNLGLAQINAISAMNSGARFIDASLAGMGKGTGNLKTEFFIAYLHSLNIKNHNLEAVLSAANYVRAHLGIGHEAVEMDEFIRGISNLSTADLKIFKQNKTSS